MNTKEQFEQIKKLKGLLSLKKREIMGMTMTIKVELLPPPLQKIRKDIETIVEDIENAEWWLENGKEEIKTKRRIARRQKRKSWMARSDEFWRDMQILKGRNKKPSRWFKQALEERDKAQ